MKREWNWILLVVVYGLLDEVQTIIPYGIFNNQPAAHDYQYEWLRNHESDFPEAGRFEFEAKKVMHAE